MSSTDEPHFFLFYRAVKFQQKERKKMEQIKYIDAAGLKPKVTKAQEAILVVCFLSASVRSHRVQLVANEIVRTLERLGFVVKHK